MSNLPSPILGLGRICGRGLAIFLVLLGWITSLAVAQPLAFRHFDDRDGLPQSQIRAILEDREGFLWIGTVEGLARLGASGFRPYRSQEQLRPTMVNCLMQDRRGSLWVGGDESGVAEIRGSRVRNFGEAEGLDITNVYSLLERQNGDILVGGRQGLFRKRGNRFERVVLPDPWKYLPIFALAEDSRGAVWMGSRKGNLFCWDGKTIQSAPLPPSLAEKSIQTLVRDPAGGLWALYPEALLRQTPKRKWVPHPLPSLPGRPLFASLSFSARGELLLAMGADGLLTEDRLGNTKTWTFRDGLPREGVTAVHRDRRGVLWIGTDGSDVLAQAVPNLRVLHTDPRTGAGLGLGGITQFLELSVGSMLLGSTQGLFLLDDKAQILGRWQSAPGVPSLEVWSMLPHPQGGVWLGTTRGLFRWHKGRVEAGTERLRNVQTHSLLSHGGRLWAGTLGEGVVELTLDGRFIAFHPLPQEVGRGVVPKILPRTWPTGPGLLVATQVGLYNFRVEGGRGLFQRAFAGTPVHSASISTMYEEPSGQLWVATRAGIFGFVKGKPGEWVHLGQAEAGIEGTPNWICRLPSGPLAVGHARGVSLVSGVSVVQLTKNQGLLSDETTTDAVFLDSQQQLWIGMKGGACILDTCQPLVKVQLPKPRVMEVAWGTESRWLPERVELPPVPGTLDLIFDTGLPAAPAIPRYQAMIEGLDRDWRAVENNANSIQVAQVGPGSYRFRLRASLDGREWVEADPLPIRVQPAWYQRTFSRVFFTLAGAGFLTLLVYWRLRTLQRQANILEGKVEERTETLRLRNKSLERLHQQLKRSLESRVQLMRTVSHDLRSPLTSIMLSVDRLRDAEELEPSDPMLNILDREARRLEAIIRGLLDQAKSESFTDSLNQRLCRPSEVLEGLTDTLRLKAEARALSHRLELDPRVDQVWILADTTALQQVLFNLIENSLKFTESPGTVGIRSILGEDNWALEVWDTGRGIDPSLQSSIFQAFRQTQIEDEQMGWGLGLSICKTLVEAHSGRIEVVSEVGKGSTFRVILPLVMPNREILTSTEDP